MDDVSTSVAEQVSTTQCGDSAEAERQLEPGFEEAAPIGEECGGFTHYAVLNGPADPNHDINHNWKLYNAAYKPPKQLELEAWDRLEAATGLDSLVCLRALLALKAGGAK
jgi:hypothetical protein